MRGRAPSVPKRWTVSDRFAPGARGERAICSVFMTQQSGTGMEAIQLPSLKQNLSGSLPPLRLEDETLRIRDDGGKPLQGRLRIDDGVNRHLPRPGIVW